MVLKRKRSDSEISSASSLFSSPLSTNYMSIDDYPSNAHQIATPSLFSSRTRKRHRDNRPSESEVYRMQISISSSAYHLTSLSSEHTLSLLFSAQQTPQPQLPTPQPFQSQEPVAYLATSFRRNQQSNLHTLWPNPSTRQTSPSSDSSSSSVNTPSSNATMDCFFQATNCEDCNSSLNPSGDGDSMMMDIDTESGNFGCTACGKQVCHGCAVSNLGSERKCLNCAGNKHAWNGVGWMGH